MGAANPLYQKTCSKLHKGIHDRTYPCLFCAEELEGKENWEEHCTTCSWQKDKSVDGDTSKVECILCSEIVTKRDITVHSLTHSSKKCQCKLCYKEYNKVNLYQHVKMLTSLQKKLDFWRKATRVIWNMIAQNVNFSSSLPDLLKDIPKVTCHLQSVLHSTCKQ